MNDLSAKQSALLTFLVDFAAEYGFPPTIRELCDHFGFKSLNTAHFHLRALERKGYIQVHRGKGRGITLASPHRPLGRRVPVVGRIAAGRPILALENIEDFLGMDKDFFGKADTFAVQVKGDSMVNAHIQDKDFVVIRIQNEAQNGDIVAALIDDEVTLKYFYREEDGLRLESANPKYPPLIFKKGDPRPFRILGVMAGLVRKK